MLTVSTSGGTITHDAKLEVYNMVGQLMYSEEYRHAYQDMHQHRLIQSRNFQPDDYRPQQHLLGKDFIKE